jgi:hypothetical protein
MYSKREVCFTVIATLAVSWYLGPPKTIANGKDQGVKTSFGDGTHPPPPPPTPPQSRFGNTEMLQADGTHPPPPPWHASAMQAG